MIAYKPSRVASLHASILGPSQPMLIMNENAGNVDSSRARSGSHLHRGGARRLQRRAVGRHRIYADGTAWGDLSSACRSFLHLRTSRVA